MQAQKAIAALILAISGLINYYQASAVPRLSVAIVRGFPGRTVEVPMTLRYSTNDVRDVVALQADVMFATTGVTDDSPTPGGITSNHVFASSTPAAGTRRLLVYSPVNSIFTNGEVARIPFSVGADEFRNFSLRLTNVIMVRADASQVFGTTSDGAVVVSPVYLAPDGNADGFLNVESNGLERCYIIQATTDFQSWVNVHTNSTDTGLLQFADAQGGGFQKRFYRAIVCESVAGALAGVQIGTITQLPGGKVQFDFNGASGRSYVIQASTNLSDWLNLRTNVGVGGPISFVDSLTNHARRFYRVRDN